MKASATEAEHAIAAAQQRKQWHRGGKTPYLRYLMPSDKETQTLLTATHSDGGSVRPADRYRQACL